jgi:hypothetical protein
LTARNVPVRVEVHHDAAGARGGVVIRLDDDGHRGRWALAPPNSATRTAAVVNNFFTSSY